MEPFDVIITILLLLLAIVSITYILKYREAVQRVENLAKGQDGLIKAIQAARATLNQVTKKQKELDRVRKYMRSKKTRKDKKRSTGR